MKDKDTGHPTRAIIRFASQAPGGLIRWYEARDAYLSESAAARRDERQAAKFRFPKFPNFKPHRQNGNMHYHMSLKRVLDRHFLKVEGTDGYYVLRSFTDESIFNQEP